MADDGVLGGQCLCGRVVWASNSEPLFSGYCYCGHCRRMSGSGRTPFIGFSVDQVSVSGETKNYRDASDRGLGIERHFCPNCGTRLYSIPGSAPDFRIFYAGTLHEPFRFTPAFSIHTSSKVAWETVPEDLDAFEGDGPA
jgi:hypothetical protein